MLLKVITDKGTFQSSKQSFSEESYGTLLNTLSQAENLKYFSLDTGTGHVIIPPALLKTAVFILEK